MNKKVFVSGCFDMLHSGHIAFFNEAAKYGDLYVALGSDRTVFDLKGRLPVNSESERLYMIKSVGCVTDAFVSTGSGYLDFENELRDMRPDIFIVNEDGNTPDKEALCQSLGIEYKILQREPHPGLSARSTTALRRIQRLPFRIDLAGGWLDQPFVSKHYPGPVLLISLEPTLNFNERSGMASSTRRTAIDLWGSQIPSGEVEKLSYVLFCCDNPPGTSEISGSQDAIGLVMPGLTKADYDGKYWPQKIESVQRESVLQFIEQSLYLIPLGPRHAEFSVLSDTAIDRNGAKALSDAAEACWEAILSGDVGGFGTFMRAAFEAQVAMFPNMVVPTMLTLIDRYRDQALGWKVTGAGGGGYLVLVSDQPIENAIRIIIRRQDE